MILGCSEPRLGRDAPALLLVKARLENHYVEASQPALGVMTLGAVARREGWRVRAVDSYLEDDPEDAVREALARFPAKVVGVSGLTSESVALHRLARVARDAAPGAVVLAGGPHPSAYPDETLEDRAIDAVVVGEGEETLREILARVTAGRSWDDVAGTVVRDESGRPRRNVPRPYIEDLDTLPLPAWDLTDLDAYSHRRGMALTGMRRYVPIMTSRGCPYRCTYCHDIQGKRFRSHSPAYVLRMIEDVEDRHGVRDFDIIDDIFNFDAERMEAICDTLIAREKRIRFTFPNGVRADRLRPEHVDKLHRAGVEYVAIAIETATKRIQKQIRKNVRFDKVGPIIDAFNERNVFTTGFFMLGFPSETEEDVRATIDFACESRLHAAFFFVVTPFQGTQLHREVGAGVGSRVRSLTKLYSAQKINLSDVPDRRFFDMHRRAYARFYFDPKRIARIWKVFPRRPHLVHLALVMIFRDALGMEPGRMLAPWWKVRGALRKAIERPGSAPRAQETAAT